MRRAERGSVGAIVLAIMVIVMLSLLALYALDRFKSTGFESAQTSSSLSAAQQALEQYAASAQRLPCPANPALDTGLEVTNGAAQCQFPEGTVPWATIGMRRDDAFDAWGRKISYRVYTGNNGSLTQPGGIAMVDCDTVEPSPAGATPTAGSAGGLCRATRDTRPDQFTAGKGLALTDNAVAYNDVAYVLISHGATGLGAWTASGVQRDIPTGDERDHTRDTGPFHVHAFSDAETKASAPGHFDDILLYRRIGDLVQRAGLMARDWPEAAAAPSLDIVLNAATVAAATGSTPATGNLGTNVLTVGGTTFSAFSSGTTAQQVSYDTSGTGGIGVGGFLPEITSLTGEHLVIALPSKFQKFAITLNNFSKLQDFFGSYQENVQLTFFNGGTQVGSPVVKSACRLPSVAEPNIAASYEISVGADFDSVDILPLSPTPASFNFTSFTVAAVAACASSTSNCRTSIATTSGGNSNTCS